jgi:hypothetical protein
MHQPEVERAGQSMQRVQSEVSRANMRLARAVATLALRMAKRFSTNLTKGKPAAVEMKVNGVTKLKGEVKDGVFKPTINTLNKNELAQLKKYYSKSIERKQDDFEVKVDGNTVLETKDGQLVTQGTPVGTQAAEAKQAFAKLQGTTEQVESSQNWVAHDQDALNLELLQQGKGALALLSNRPVGERSWEGNQYSMQEKGEGFTITHQTRGVIAKLENGKVTGQATAQDLEKLNRLLDVAKQTYVSQAPVKEKALGRGGIRYE